MFTSPVSIESSVPYVLYAVCYVLCVMLCSEMMLHRLETEVCLPVWILTISSSVLCVLMLVGMFKSVNVKFCIM